MGTYFILAAIFIILGLAVHKFKMYFLISGYNTMPKAAKANVDIQGLARLMGFYGYINGGIFIVFGILNALGIDTSMIPATIIIIGSTVLMIIKARKYDMNVYGRFGMRRYGSGKRRAISAVITAVTLIFVAILLFLSVQPTKVTFIDDGLKIHGMYGETITWDAIEDIKLEEALPKIEMRSNGAAVGSHLKGHFKTKEWESVKLFVRANKPPFIYIFRTNAKPIIFNMENEESTNKVYKDLESKVGTASSS
jgi:hypothetical protein